MKEVFLTESILSVCALLKMDHSLPLFLNFRLFNTVDSNQMFKSINIADDWIRTADHWCWKRPQYHCTCSCYSMLPFRNKLQPSCPVWPDGFYSIDYLSIYNREKMLNSTQNFLKSVTFFAKCKENPHKIAKVAKSGHTGRVIVIARFDRFRSSLTSWLAFRAYFSLSPPVFRSTDSGLYNVRRVVIGSKWMNNLKPNILIVVN